MINETPELIDFEERLAIAVQQLYRLGETEEEIMGCVSLALNEAPERETPCKQ